MLVLEGEVSELKKMVMLMMTNDSQLRAALGLPFDGEASERIKQMVNPTPAQEV